MLLKPAGDCEDYELGVRDVKRVEGDFDVTLPGNCCLPEEESGTLFWGIETESGFLGLFRHVGMWRDWRGFPSAAEAPLRYFWRPGRSKDT